MSPRAKLNLLLGFALMILCLPLLLPTGSRRPEDTRLPLNLRAGLITTMTLRTAPERQTPEQSPKAGGLRTEAANGTVALERVDDEWRLTQPFAHPANPVAITQLLELLDIPARKVPLPQISNREPVDLMRSYGLHEPSHSLWMNETRIDFGGNSPIGRKRYLRVQEQIFLVEDKFEQLLKGSVFVFCSPAVLFAAQRLTQAKLHDLRTQSMTVLPRERLNSLDSALRTSAISAIGPAKEVRAADLAVLSLETTHPNAHIELTLRDTGQSLVVERVKPALAYHLTRSAGRDFLQKLNRVFVDHKAVETNPKANAH